MAAPSHWQAPWPLPVKAFKATPPRCRLRTITTNRRHPLRSFATWPSLAVTTASDSANGGRLLSDKGVFRVICCADDPLEGWGLLNLLIPHVTSSCAWQGSETDEATRGRVDRLMKYCGSNAVDCYEGFNRPAPWGDLDTSSSARLASFLRQLRTAIEVPDIAVRLAVLEEKNALDFR